MLRSIVVVSLLMVAPSHAADWEMDPQASSIEISYTQGSNETSARFDDFTTAITFDPADLDNASIRADIEIASFNSGNPQIDGAVAGADWFSTANFPTAAFESQTIEDLGDGTYAIHGELTIRENAVPITLTGPIAIDGDRATASVSVDLNRTNYGVGQGDFESESQVGHSVPVRITIEATLK